ncbi:putative pectinesterase/pectinesterase inhibitor 20 [Acorus calamus]|uniref:Pectinesterase/pectinesterase inhibitor 20 n=1 Tax=Acorus calamus TaxID=4465 RepID=A0AAV9EZ18_ACOCL|nr:putative pectinesterase/pectinesterase inhibitor 20 [Acorus calamus]
MSDRHVEVFESWSGRSVVQDPGGVFINDMVVVSKNGTGDFTNITEALGARLKARLSMMEHVTVNKTQMFVMMIGDGINRTIITGDRSNSTGWSTFGSATVGGCYWTRFRSDEHNNAKHNGTIRRPGSGPNEQLRHGEPALEESSGGGHATKTFLGRPWGVYSRTVIMESYLDSLIEPAGWLRWSSDSVLNTLYYGEFNNTGPGSNTSGRVTWPGFHVMNTSDAVNFHCLELHFGEQLVAPDWSGLSWWINLIVGEFYANFPQEYYRGYDFGYSMLILMKVDLDFISQDHERKTYLQILIKTK